jgi:hypothetical protein
LFSFREPQCPKPWISFYFVCWRPSWIYVNCKRVQTRKFGFVLHMV